MTKSEVAALALSAVAAMGSIIAAVHANQANSGLAALGDRVARLESTPPAVSSAPAVVPANTDLARELAALKSRLATLEARPSAAAAKPVVANPADPAVAEAAAGKAKEAEEQRQKVWLEALSQRITGSLTENLQLTAQQESQVREILSTQLVNYRQARLGSSPEQSKKSLEELTADTDAKIKPLLTQEQQAKYDELVKRPGGIFAMPGAPPAVRLNGGAADLAK